MGAPDVDDTDGPAPVPRIGILHPARPHPIVAAAEARVLEHELSRRLGEVTLDLRVDGEHIGVWQPMSTASWPTDVDAVLDTDLWAPDLPPLASLFARTVEAGAAEVRRRMLEHLGVLPCPTFDQSALDALPDTIRVTDVWLIVSGADDVGVDDAGIAAFGSDPGDQARLDAALDAVADGLSVHDEVDRSTRWSLQRSVAATAVWRRRAAELESELAQSTRAAAERLDELEAEIGVLRERLERNALDDPAAPS